MEFDPKKNPPERCVPPEQWWDLAIRSGRTLQEVWAAQLHAHKAGATRSLRDLAKFITSQFWGDCCAYCGDALGEGWTWEHFVAQSFGGTDDAENCIPACKDCNSRRGSGDPWSYMAKLGRTASQIQQTKDRVELWRQRAAESKSVPMTERRQALLRLMDVGVCDEAFRRYGYLPTDLLVDPEPHDDEVSLASESSQ